MIRRSGVTGVSREGFSLPGRLGWFGIFLLILLAGAAGPVAAHFLLNVNIRIVHVEHLDEGLRVYLRLPAPYVLAPLIGAEKADGTVAPAPYTTNRMIDGELMHALDPAALKADPLGLGRLVAEGHSIVAEGVELTPEVEAVRVYPALQQVPFATLNEARKSFDNPVLPPDMGETFVGDSVIDVRLRYRAAGGVYGYSFSSSLNPGLEGQDKTANLILDHFVGEPLVFRESGLLAEPLAVSRSAWKAAYGFVVDGTRHILQGSDHVLFVLCLIIGAFTLGDLLWRVTGFTVGHTVTLILGFFGFVPGGAWFVPAVETGIALSIIYAGIIALLRRRGAGTIAVTAGIGLLHGLGFSFVLHEILRIDSPNLWQSLLAFNLGVELGQLAIVLAVWPVLWLLARQRADWAQAARWVVALPCITLAALWVGQRSLQILAAF